MEFNHNAVFKIVGSGAPGVYRVIVASRRSNVVAAVLVISEGISEKAQSRLVHLQRTAAAATSLRWFRLDDLEAKVAEGAVLSALIAVPAVLYRPVSPKHSGIFDRRVRIMHDFLEPKVLEKELLAHHGWGRLVAGVSEQQRVSRQHIYKLIASLCRFGFAAKSLAPKFDRCGAPGVARPADPGVRLKAGRKSAAERGAIETGEKLPEESQPGITTDWRNRILAADAGIPSPKPGMSQRVDLIRASHFVTTYEDVAGELTPVLGSIGTYPNRSQIRRVLDTAYPELQRLIQSTTKGHFERSLRGAKGRSWNGVAGPGHTWAIDSTVGDMFLRSSINRAWFLGRPIVYIIVDVWSTAVVGFYVCLAGPSWRMARTAIFNACAPIDLMSALWGFDVPLSLDPAPTLCANLLCDRGEYLSHAASIDGLHARLALSYSPPYRPDCKGIVEVLHRIEKDGQYFMIPGAIDARRAEYELRRYRPGLSVFTVRELVHYLTITFLTYNLTADRSHRLDAHMIGANVTPTPSGLWNWGHQIGIGFTRDTPVNDLIATWLDPQRAFLSREGLKFAGCHYESAAVSTGDWTTRARNFGGWELDVLTYPGSVSRLWTAQHTGDGLLQFDICEHARASRELTHDEVADAFAVQKERTTPIAHKAAVSRVNGVRATQRLVENARRLTAEAEKANTSPRPTIKEARMLEQSPGARRSGPRVQAPARMPSLEQAEETYVKTLAGLLSEANEEGGA